MQAIKKLNIALTGLGRMGKIHPGHLLHSIPEANVSGDDIIKATQLAYAASRSMQQGTPVKLTSPLPVKKIKAVQILNGRYKQNDCS